MDLVLQLSIPEMLGNGVIGRPRWRVISPDSCLTEAKSLVETASRLSPSLALVCYCYSGASASQFTEVTNRIGSNFAGFLLVHLTNPVNPDAPVNQRA